MAFSSEIIAKLGIDTGAFTRGLAIAKQNVSNFGDEVGSTLQKKLSSKDVFRGFLQGLGIGSVQQIADRIVEPFRKAAESAREIASLIARVADSNIARNRSELSAGGQLLLVAKDRARLEQEFFDLSSRKRKSEGDIVRLAELELKINESLTREKSLRAEVEKAAATDRARLDREHERLVDKGRAEAARDRENQDAWAAKKLQFETSMIMALAAQKELRKQNVELARKEAIEAEAKADQETLTTVDAVNRAAESQGFAGVSEDERRALKEWIKGGKKGPPPITREGNLRDQLGSAARDRTNYLIDGMSISGQPRSRAEFASVSVEALQEFIRRQESIVSRIDSGYGSGASALVEVVTGGLIRALAKSTLQTEIGYARDRLRDFERFSGADRAAALRDFEGDPLAFDRLYESSQRSREASERAAHATEELTRLFKTGQARTGAIIVGG